MVVIFSRCVSLKQPHDKIHTIAAWGNCLSVSRIRCLRRIGVDKPTSSTNQFGPILSNCRIKLKLFEKTKASTTDLAML